MLKIDKVDLNSSNKYGRTLLHSAAEEGNLEIVKLLTGTGRVNCNLEGKYSRMTPLSIAIEAGSDDVAKHLLSTGQCKVGGRSIYAPLRLAVKLGRVSIVRILLEEFIDDMDLQSPEIWEQSTVWGQKEKYEIIHQMLLDADAKKKASDRGPGRSKARKTGLEST